MYFCSPDCVRERAVAWRQSNSRLKGKRCTFTNLRLRWKRHVSFKVQHSLILRMETVLWLMHAVKKMPSVLITNVRRKDSPTGGRSSWNANSWLQEWESILDSNLFGIFQRTNILVKEKRRNLYIMREMRNTFFFFKLLFTFEVFFFSLCNALACPLCFCLPAVPYLPAKLSD